MSRKRGAVDRFAVVPLMAGGLLAISAVVSAMFAVPAQLSGQQVEPVTVLRVPVGNSSVVMHGAVLDRVSIGNPEVADAVVVSAREVVING